MGSCRSCSTRRRRPPLSAHSSTGFGVLFRHADPDALLRCVDVPDQRSALDHASHVTHDLAVVDHHLRKQLGEEHRTAAGPAEPAAHDTGPDKVVGALTRTGDRLAGTILGTTDANWQRATIGRHRALDLVTLILHDADHGFHEAERALHAASAAPEPRSPTRSQLGDRPLRMR